jgi:hypothetical protein
VAIQPSILSDVRSVIVLNGSVSKLDDLFAETSDDSRSMCGEFAGDNL